MIEYKERVTSQEDLSVEVQKLAEGLSQKADTQSLVNVIENFQHTLGGKATKEDLKKSISDMLEVANKIQSQVCDMSVFGISDRGYVDIKEIKACPIYKGDNGSNYSLNIPLEFQKKQVRLTLRSDYDALKQRVDNLTTQLSKLKAETRITPVTNCDLRKRGSTLYPQYGDWLLTSDVEDQYISLSGLRAELGRSIYIQTRKRAYLYTNNQSFYGLPGSSTRENQWLSKNTTYRFVRCSSDSWFVTSGPSPYPWT